ncbi:hypothetical protein OU995_21235 [Roseateles sp. SL47]|uniref:hypothetical protein n=1 Tax=Roseateles sp. SL47 TaxID=2995138 RepID=UPI00226F9EDF|nr:hypothetical protein [Roseateles sp. SL47]WAC72070.1 hypothetical protein OU995_21235 [Roseateles sp. SL47]
MRFIITGMAGSIQAVDARLLGDSVGENSVNQRPRLGELTPWRQAAQVAAVPFDRRTIYRMGRDVLSDTAYWMSWTTVVHVVRGFYASDSTERTYFTGSGAPKVTDNVIGLAAPPYPTAARELGVPAPDGSSLLTVAAVGSGDERLVFYADTFITDKGEESKPRIIGSLTARPSSTVSIANLPAVPAGNYGITTRRIYRSEVGTSGQSDFFFLKDIPSTDPGTLDEGLAVGAGTLATTGWEMPPADLKCLIGLWSGMLAGISGRSVRFCESYKGYAWPVAYEFIPADVTPVGLAVWSGNLLVLTTGRPYILSGSLPGSMSDQSIPFEKGCVSERSICNVEHGVVWASPDGLAYYGDLGARLLTDGILTRDQWLALNPETLVGVLYEGLYLGSYEVQPGGARRCFAINTREPAGIYYAEQGFTCAFLDKLRDSVFILDGGSIKKWDAGQAFTTATFRSKVFRSAQEVTISAGELIARRFPATVRAYCSAVDEATGEVIFELRDERVVTDGEAFTLDGGSPGKEWQFEIATAGTVIGANFAPSLRDLRAD